MEFRTPSDEPAYFSKQTSAAKRFYRPVERIGHSAGTPFRVVAGGREFCSPGYRVARESFGFFAVEFVTSGLGSVTVGSESEELSAGTVFAYGPGIPHRIEQTGNEPLVKYFVNITGEHAAYLLDGETGILGRIMHTSTPHSILQSFEELVEHGLEDSPWSDKICAGLTEVLAFKIAGSALIPGEPGTTAHGTYRRCRNLIGTRYLEFATLAEAASACAVDPAYLCRLFRRFDHQTPYRYLLRLKMNHAADLLLESRLQVQEVAAKMGYPDPLHFSRTFKGAIGVSPTRLIELSMG
jgi:AraC-like DNA-binding protein